MRQALDLDLASLAGDGSARSSAASIDFAELVQGGDGLAPPTGDGVSGAGRPRSPLFRTPPRAGPARRPIILDNFDDEKGEGGKPLSSGEWPAGAASAASAAARDLVQEVTSGLPGFFAPPPMDAKGRARWRRSAQGAKTAAGA